MSDDSAPRTFVVPASLDGARLDKALTVLAELSRSRAKAVLEEGVRVNGRRAPKGAQVRTGDQIELPGAPRDEVTGSPADPTLPLDVRLETDDLLVLYKPPRIPTAPLQPGERGTLVSALLARFPELSSIGDSPLEPGLVHRLDTDTSGLVLVARTARAFAVLKPAIREGRIEKRYLAIVAEGVGAGRAASVAANGPLPDVGTITFPLTQHPKDRRRMFACVHPRDVARLSPRDAETTYRVLQRFRRDDDTPLALVEARAPRALRHQIRVHLAAVGSPLLGDGLYGGPPDPALGRHALHASRIAWPGSAELPAFVVDAPLPDDLASIVQHAESRPARPGSEDSGEGSEQEP